MKCDRDCFHCKYDDCYQNDITSAERKEMNKRDERYKEGEIPKSYAIGRKARARKIRQYKDCCGWDRV